MDVSIKKAAPSDAAMLLEYLKQVGGETDNLTFGLEGMPFSVEAEAEFISSIDNLIIGCINISIKRITKMRLD